ncbi:MAG: ribonuclease P protein component [Acidobacteria bacterium]|nr:ribonuclease P protein component [Acidobacteriota bacterium]
MNASKKPQKLRNSQQFRRVYDEGQRFHTPFFSAFILKTDTDEPRCGITVTRKVGSAVVRNRCKRRLREVIRRYYSKTSSEGLSTAGYDLVLNAKLSLLAADFNKIEESFSRIMERFNKSLLEEDK